MDDINITKWIKLVELCGQKTDSKLFTLRLPSLEKMNDVVENALKHGGVNGMRDFTFLALQSCLTDLIDPNGLILCEKPTECRREFLDLDGNKWTLLFDFVPDGNQGFEMLG